MITIFTPTYNRKKLLKRVYESLKVQTNNDFEWVIVDDGSEDETGQTVIKWIDEGIVSINYIFQKNQGKHVAFNTAVRAAKGELFFCVDSDDYIVPDAVDDVINIWEKGKNENISGIIALKADNFGNILCDNVPHNISQTNAYDLVRKYNCIGEKTLIYKTSILRQNPYPQIPGEKFIGENVLYDRIDTNYEMIYFDKILTICEYQNDGLTNNLFKIMLDNPTGYKIYYKQRIDMAHTFKERISYIIRYNAFKQLSNNNQYEYRGKYKFIVKLLSPFGFMAKRYYLNKKKKN